MTKRERLIALLSGTVPDTPPVSFWYHFPPDQWHGLAAVQAHLNHLRQFDLDFLKIMNDNPYPQQGVVRNTSDLETLKIYNGHEAGYGKQLDLIRSLKDELADEVVLVTTLFNAWALLRKLVREPASKQHKPPDLSGKLATADQRVSDLLVNDRQAVGKALNTLAQSQANFADRCIQAGADGIFFSVRDDWTDTQENGLDTYDQLVRAGDLQILESATAGSCNMLHVCGLPKNFDRFAAYPVAAINWADRVADPTIADAIGTIKPVICAGVDNLGTLVNGTPEDVAAEVSEARQQAGDRPIIISPGCTYDPDLVPKANLHAMVNAARNS